MNGKCFEIGTIQAFLDGELESDLSLKVTRHVAACNKCALLLTQAEDENAIVFSALEREFNTLVPTQRLWTKINDSIFVEKNQAPFWQKIFAFLSVHIGNPSLAVAASVLIVFGVFAVVWSLRSNGSSNEVPTVTQDIPKSDSIDTAAFQGSTGEIIPPPATGTKNIRNDSRDFAIKADYRANDRKMPTSGGQRPNTASGYLPGEESYVKTIASLTQTVAGQKDSVLRPSSRVAYEQDMAVVDDAIKKMKAEVRKNPKNESAKQVLYSSYQNKIDLLNSVTQREELMASLKY